MMAGFGGRRLLGTALALGVGAMAVPLVSSPAPAATGSSEFSATKQLERIFQSKNANGEVVDDVVDSRAVTVKADKTKDLRGRERIHISWSGAHATGSRAVNPYGQSGLEQEYPVVIMQCRGTGDTVSPQTCWTSTRPQRSEVSISDPAAALWRVDPFADPTDRELLSGVTPFPDTSTCPARRDAGVATHLTPFKAAKGTLHYACSDATMPPEASVNSAFPPAELAAFTDVAGKGDVQFEVRSSVENESLGCSDKVDCSIVVIPIMGLSCMPKDGTTDPAHDQCVKPGQYLPGEAANAKDFDKAVSPRFWWSASNWRNRITIPITFGPPPNVCELLDSRKPVGFYGSELMAQAGLQWAPAYCLDQTRFKFQANKMPDDAAFDLLDKGEVGGAFVSRARETTGATVGYAPTAITGFSIAYLIDKPDNSGEYSELRLTPRLLAKLLTNSYPAVLDGRDHPGMANNPLRIYNDPEFKALNPGLKPDATVSASALMSLSVSSDVIWTLTNYLNRDPEARAFLDGNPDPWGMLVNPAYRGISLPVASWPLNDTWVMPSGDPESCEGQNTTPYFTQVAGQVSSLRTIGEAVLDGWPLAQTKYSTYDNPRYGAAGEPRYLCKSGRIDRQDIGHRFMMGVTDLGDAERFGLRSAQLQSSAAQTGAAFTDDAGRTFVGPTQGGLAEALPAFEPAGVTVPFNFNPAMLPAAGYPGTMVVYTAAPLYGMDLTLAKNVAMFMRISTTEGQVPGSGNGQLPDGYLPLRDSGKTSALWKQAKVVADLVEAQKTPPATPTPTPTASTFNSSSDTATAAPTDAESPAAAAVADAAKAGKDKDGKDQAQATTFIETDPTAVKTSKVAALLLPLMILGAAICMLATPVLRMVIAQQDPRDAG